MSRPARRRLSLRRKLLYSLVPLLLAGVMAEVAARIAYYQINADKPLALQRVYAYLQDQQLARAIKAARQRFAASHDHELVSLADKRARYEAIFAHFVAAAKKANARLLVMFVPEPGGSTPTNLSARAFFKGVAESHDLPMLDLNLAFSEYPNDLVYLTPEDGHTSRLGNHVIADALHSALEPLLAHRSMVAYTDADRPELLGDLEPSRNYIFWKDAPLPCRVITNSQGLRRGKDLAFPKSDRVRILCIGDSYTFGHAMHNSQCYPQILERLFKGPEVVNAGILGYTICDETAYLEERGRFVEPDIIVLQVFPNDLDGLSPELQQTYCRGGSYCKVQDKLR